MDSDPGGGAGGAPDRNSAGAISAAEMAVAAEYEDQQTIHWLRQTLSRHGTVVDLPWAPDFSTRLARCEPDVVFNITEATGGRNRESLVPAIAESLQIPFTGSDALALGLSLNKGYAKTIAEAEGIPCPAGYTASRTGRQVPCLDNLRFPVIVKPLSGGSSMGISGDSKVTSTDQLASVVQKTARECGDDVIVEEFIRGKEFAVAVVDKGDGPIALPVAEVVFNDGDPDAFYSIDLKSAHKKKIVCPAELDESVSKLLCDYSLKLFYALKCWDLARVDYRLADNGKPYFLEINPLPGLSPYYGIFPVQAKAAGIQPEDIVAYLIANAISRSKEHIRYA